MQYLNHDKENERSIRISDRKVFQAKRIMRAKSMGQKPACVLKKWQKCQYSWRKQNENIKRHHQKATCMLRVEGHVGISFHSC